MAQYDANINVNVNAKQAEAQLTKLQQSLDKLSRTSANINVTGAERGLQNFKQTASKVGTEVKNIFNRGLFAGAILGAGQLGTSLAAATSHLGPFTGAVKAAGAAFSSSLGGAPALIGNILNQIGHIPNAMGLAAVAAMAFAPQLLKASSAAVGLGAAIDKAVGPKAVSGIAGFAEKLTSVEQQFKRIAAPMELLREELNLANKEFDKYVAFTDQSVAAAQQLLAVERQVTAEKRAQNTLLTQLDPFAARRVSLQQRIARIRRGEEGGTAGFREFMGRQTVIGAGAERARLQNEARARRFAAAGISPGTQYPGEIGPGPASEVALSTQLRGRLQQLVQERKRNTEAIRETVRENIRESQVARQAREDSLAAIRLRSQEIRLQRQLERRGLQQLTTGAVAPGITAGFGVQGPALPPRITRPAAAAAGGGRSRLSGVVSNAVIGGAFPLLFGQGGAAATGGAIGGLLGGAFGGAGGFAGSLLGTLLGQIAGQAGQVKELAADIGFSAQQTQLLATAFKQAGSDFDKFQASVSRIQGLGLSLEQQAAAIQLASTLTEAYGGKIDKVTNAFTNALQTGKVTQATLNQLTSSGIPIQEALANKYDVSRSKLLEMAKGGEISVQALLDALVDLGNRSEKVSNNVQSSFEQAFTRVADKLSSFTPRINTAFENVKEAGTNAFTNILQALEPLIVSLADATVKALELYGAFVSAFAGIPGYVNNITNAVLNMLPGLNVLNIALNTLKGARGVQPQRQGPAVPPRLQQAPIPRIIAPAQMTAAGGGKGGGGADKAAKDAAREAERVAKILRDTQAETELLRIQSQLQDSIFKAEQAKDPLLAARLKGEQDIIELQSKYANLLANEPNIRAQEAIVTKGLQEIENARLKTAQNLQKIDADRLDKYNTLIEDLNLELELKTVANEQDQERLRIEFEINRLRKENIYTEEQLATIQQKRMALAAQDTPGQKRMKELQKSLTELTNQETLAAASADNIGQAFGNAFQEIITGASSGQEALANMMRSIGENFVNMAAQIIAQQMTMIILGTIMKALGLGFGAASAGGSLPGSAPQMTPGAVVTPTGFEGMFAGVAAKGAYFHTGIAKFANGGIVGQPTLFKFADGGATRTGLMGEAGPEAIMPLQRDGSGRLGVNAMGLREAMASGGAGTGPVLNMSFETTRFGDTEYVSRDQLEAAMVATRRQAATDGAKRGMSMTLDRIQNSTSTRRKIGI